MSASLSLGEVGNLRLELSSRKEAGTLEHLLKRLWGMKLEAKSIRPSVCWGQKLEAEGISPRDQKEKKPKVKTIPGSFMKTKS